MHFWIRLLVLPACLLAFTIGCNNNDGRSGELSGKVSYKGQPVTGGSMTIYIGDAGYPVAISPDGRYTASQLPEGEATATVDTQQLNPKKPTYGGREKGGLSAPPAGATAGPQGTYVAIPAKYKTKDKSDLKVTVKKGKQEHNFELKD